MIISYLSVNIYISRKESALRFTIVLPPKGQKRARSRALLINGKAISGKPRKDSDQLIEEKKMWALMYAHRPPEPLQGPLALGVKAYLPIPESKPKKWQARALAGQIRPTTKPDLDNCIKNLKDVCKGVFWQDDKQIVEYLPGTGKYYGQPARWEIIIEELKVEEIQPKARRALPWVESEK